MQLAPYLMFDGNCEEALNFYAKVLGGQIPFISRYGDMPPSEMKIKDSEKKKVMHANFVSKNVSFMASDSNEQAPKLAKGNDVHLCLIFDNAAEEEKVYKALSEGGRVNMPLQDTFWGSKFAMLTDKYGFNWMLDYTKPEARK
jgi:PhnB protein